MSKIIVNSKYLNKIISKLEYEIKEVIAEKNVVTFIGVGGIEEKRDIHNNLSFHFYTENYNWIRLSEVLDVISEQPITLDLHNMITIKDMII